ncbi:hypothetical protein SprV_0100250300 [Sparganum proliferum]
MDLFAAACESFDLVINTEKTVVMHHPPPNGAPPSQCAANQRERNTTAIGGLLHLSWQHPLKHHQNRRRSVRQISKASQVFGRLENTIWSRHGLQLRTKLKVHNASTSATVVSAMPINTVHNPDTQTNANTITVNTNEEDRVYTCPHCDRTFTTHIRLVGHLRIHRTETGEPALGAPTYTRCIRFHCSYCPRTFMHHMGLFGHVRIHESGVDPNTDTLSTSITHAMPGPAHIPSPSGPTTIISTTIATEADTDTSDSSCSQCRRTVISRIGLAGHLRIHHTAAGEPVPGEPVYILRIRLHCPYCTRPFIHCMGLFGHVRVHENLW